MNSSSKTKVAIIAAMEREVSPLIKNWNRVEQNHEGHSFTFYERADAVLVCGGIGAHAARRAAEAAIALYQPSRVQSVGFAGALDANLHVGDIFTPSQVLDARDGSRFQLQAGKSTLITFMEVAGSSQKKKLASAYAAQAVDMEAAAVASAARAHNIDFTAIKVISDDADFEMPGMERFIDSQGRFRTLRFVLFAAPRPWLWGRVAALAANSGKASQALAVHLQRSLHDPNLLVISTPTSLGTGGHD